MKVHIFDKKQVLYVVLAIILLCIGMVCALRAVTVWVRQRPPQVLPIGV